MKVMFVNHNISLWVNVGMTYVMSAVEHDHDVVLVDRMKQRARFKRYLLNEVARHMPAVVAFSVNSYTVIEANALVEKIKAQYPHIFVVYGGVHPTIMPEESIAIDGVDAICIGEGEHVFAELLQSLESGNDLDSIRGLYFKNAKGIISKNMLRPFAEDLDQLPWPNWDLWDIDAYMNHGEIVPGTLRVLTSRGCPYSCSFCSNPVWQTSLEGSYYRRRSTQKIIEEIEYNYAKYSERGFSFLMISDSIFGLDKEHGKEFCRRYIETGLARTIPWGAQMRCGTLDQDYAFLLRQAGCVRMNISIESGNDHMRNTIYKKNMSKDEIFATVHYLRSAGIMIRAFVMVGGPGEDNAMFTETMRFTRSLGLSLSDLIIIKYTPLPHTALVAKINANAIVRSHSLFCYKHVTALQTKMTRSCFLKLKMAKIICFLKEILKLRGVRVLSDIFSFCAVKKSAFFPLLYLCSEQRIINRTIVAYKIKKMQQ
jgi:anaerobic magnesium-protoporphyrin IX monomethyl ester cyclase